MLFRGSSKKILKYFSLAAVLIFLALWLRITRTPAIPDDDPTSVPINYGGWVYPSKNGITKKDVYFLLKDLGKKYGLTSKGSGFEGDNYGEWQIGVFCKKNLTSHFSILGKEGNLGFSFYAYGFRKISDYESFKEESITVLKQYGNINQIKQNPILSDAVMQQKETLVWKGEDLTSKCEGK